MKSTVLFLVLILSLLTSYAANQNYSYIDSVSQIEKNMDYKQSISVSLNFTHFIPTEEAKDQELSPLFFAPGIEAQYNIKLKHKLIFSAGLNYQFGKLKSPGPYEKRLTFSELSVPLLITKPLLQNRTDGIVVSTGIYLGKYISSKIETKSGRLNSIEDWHELPGKYIDNYTSDDMLADLYLGLGYRNKITSQNYFRLDVFTKYKLKEHWINNEVSQWLVGAKIVFNLEYALENSIPN